MTSSIRTLGFVLASLIASSPAAAQSRVSEIIVGDSSKECVADVWLAPPKALAGRKEVCRGHLFAPGTTVEVPARTTLKVHNASVPENVVTLEANSRTRLVAGPKGERHTGLIGRAWFEAGKRLGFYTVIGGKVHANLGTTVLRTDITDETIGFSRIEGEIKVSKPVRVKIGDGAGSDAERSRAKELTTTEFVDLVDHNASVEYAVDHYETEYKTFATADEAMAEFYRLIEQEDTTSEEVADLLSTVGHLYLDEERPEDALKAFTAALQTNMNLSEDGFDPVIADNLTDLGYTNLDLGKIVEAISHFETALEVRAEIDPSDPWVADSCLDLSDAWSEYGDEKKSASYAQRALDLLQEQIGFNEQDYQLALQEDEQELAEAIRLELADILELAAYAFENLDNQDEADALFRESDRIYREIYGDDY